MKDYSNSQFIEIVNEYIHSERDRSILIDRYVNGLLFKELEDKYGLSERQVDVKIATNVSCMYLASMKKLYF